MRADVRDAQWVIVGLWSLTAASLAGCGRSDLDAFDGVVDATEPEGEAGHSDASVKDAVSDDSTPIDGSIDVVVACGVQNCGGCCSLDGACHMGPNNDGDEFCGAHGEPCEKCDVDAGFHGCKSGTCLRFGQPCSPTNCSGCCFGGICASGSHDNACGAKGEACALCAPDKGETCTALPDGGGTCGAAVCSAKTCSGCCLGNVCAVGSQDFACGAGGAECQDCVFFGKSCKAHQCAK